MSEDPVLFLAYENTRESTFEVSPRNKREEKIPIGLSKLQMIVFVA